MESPPVKQSFLRRNKFVLPLLLTVNVAAGAYLLLKPKDEETNADKSTATSTQAVSTSTMAPQVEATPSEPLKPREPIPEDQQRELFKWMLEEKRKVKPIDREEKKRIDEERAILKQFIRAKSIPAI